MEKARTFCWPRALKGEKIIELVVTSAGDAFFKTLLVLIFGSMALGIARSIFQDMIPTPPPGLTLKAEAEAASAWTLGNWHLSVGKNLPVIVFALMFVLTFWGCLRDTCEPQRRSGGSAWLKKFAGQLSENWFGLFVGNAFDALVSAFAFNFFSQLEFSRMIFNGLLEAFLPQIRAVGVFLFGANATDLLHAWFNWYGQNELKFTFWLFYLAAISDDLGIPNLKSLGRSVARRLRKRVKSREQARRKRQRPKAESPKVQSSPKLEAEN